MNIKTIAQVILFSSFCTTFSSCSGQQTTESTDGTVRNQEPVSSIGETVAALGKSTRVIHQDKKGHHWFGGEGVYRYDTSTQLSASEKQIIHYTTKDGLCANSVTDIQEDENGNIYFDTTEGVCMFDGNQFTTLKVVTNPENEWKLEPTDLWFRKGWDSNGPYRFDGKDLYQLDFPKTAQEDAFRALYPNVTYSPYGIYSIFTDSKGHLWFGTSSLGVCRYDGKSIRWLYEDHLTNTPAGGSFGIRSIMEDNDGYYWFCNTRYKYMILPDDPANGLDQLAYKRENGVGFVNEKGETVHPYFMSIAKAKNGDLWMASYDEGVWRNDGKTLSHYPIKADDKQVLLHSIYVDNDGVIWVGTQNDGVFRLNEEGFVKF